ncbi:hypothetical protein C0992_000001, partial [Termitomyces sp. T32_za158]
MTTIHKRGPSTSLSNYRGITCSNLLANLPFAWLNSSLLPYLTKTGILPSTQVASQPGIQQRDLISLLAQRDQKKGFDMLEPQGFYDALAAYHLPSSIEELDRSAQSHVPYRVKTAYGFTNPFIVDGVTKQGGSLSPLKCILTTSLLNHWMTDHSQANPGVALTLSSHQANINRPHVSADSVSIPLNFVEAMDNSLMFATAWRGLCSNARLADQFQTSYGWETAWSKSALYLFNIDLSPPNQEYAMVPSVDKDNPASPTTIWNRVRIVRDHITFLRVPVNRPDLQALHMKELVNSFFLPYSWKPLPITALNRIIAQRLISKLRPCLALQPISPDDATTIDHLIAHKIHHYFGFPFHFQSSLLTTPIDYFGLGLPSISTLNQAAALNGLQRDVSHPVPIFHKTAQLTLNDWACSYNACILPTILPPPKRSLCRLHNKIPSAWLYACMYLEPHHLTLIPTNLSFLYSPLTALKHYTNTIDVFPSFATLPKLSRFTLAQLHQNNITRIEHIGSFSFSPHYSFTFTYNLLPHLSPAINRHLRIFLQWFATTLPHLPTISPAGPSLFLPPPICQQIAERYVSLLPLLNSSHISQFSIHNVYASDASCTSLQYQRNPTYSLLSPSSLTLAVVGPNLGFVSRLPSNAYLASTSHAEVAACLAAVLHASTKSGGIIYSDYLPIVNWLNSQSPAAFPSAFHAWLHSIVQRAHPPEVRHVKAHTNSTSLPACLNRAADHYASNCHSSSSPPLPFPIPTFAMAPFVFFSHHRGFIEGNITKFITTNFARDFILNYPVWTKLLGSPLLFDLAPPPSFLYERTPFAYSAMIQLYARSGQLDSRDICASRFADDRGPLC